MSTSVVKDMKFRPARNANPVGNIGSTTLKVDLGVTETHGDPRIQISLNPPGKDLELLRLDNLTVAIAI